MYKTDDGKEVTAEQLLKYAIAEIRLANDGCSTENEFCLAVGQVMVDMERIIAGSKNVPANWDFSWIK